MAWIETIEIRSLKASCENWTTIIHDVARDLVQSDPNVSVEVYCNAVIETDLFIELIHHSEEMKEEGSKIGIRLASMCSSLGMVNHNIWKERELYVRRKNQFKNRQTHNEK